MYVFLFKNCFDKYILIEETIMQTGYIAKVFYIYIHLSKRGIWMPNNREIVAYREMIAYII